MRLFISLVLFLGGIALLLLGVVTDAFTNARALSYYQAQLQSLPVKETYSRAELADAAWQVWTNRMTLPAQESYTITNLKMAIIRPLIGPHQESCDRRLFEHAIAKMAGYRGNPDKGTTSLAIVGISGALVGAFLLGRILFPAARHEHGDAA
jgi:hypothetical protein